MSRQSRYFCCLIAVSVALGTSSWVTEPALANEYANECNELAAASVDLRYLDRYKRGRVTAVCSRAAEADPNNAELAYRLGRIQAAYETFDAAETQLLKAAELGSADAYYELSQGYRNDKRRDDHESRANAALLAAAIQGHAQAQHDYARILEENGSTGAEAIEWYEKAASNGNPNAQFLLGTRLLHGRNMTPDVEQGLHWIQQAAQASLDDQASVAAGTYRARSVLAYLSDRNKLKENDYSPQIARLEDAAELGSVDAMYQLGVNYWTGTDVPQDRDTAYDWFFKITSFEVHGKAVFAMGIYQYEVNNQPAWASMLFAQAANIEPNLREQALELSALAARQASDEQERRNRENIRNNYYAALGRKPPPMDPQLTLLIAAFALGLAMDAAGIEGAWPAVTSPSPHNPCSNPWYAAASRRSAFPC